MPMRSAEEVVELVRHLRHDYLNHFQVISGYLELGMPERAQSYISGILDDAAREREILSLKSSELGLVLYQVYLHWRVQGIIFLFKTPEPVAEWASAGLPALVEKMIGEQGWRPSADDDLYLEVLLKQDDDNHISLSISEPQTGSMAQAQITRE